MGQLRRRRAHASRIDWRRLDNRQGAAQRARQLVSV